MTRTGYALRLLFGRVCFLAYMCLPYSHKFPGWVLAWAGFYAHDEGYEHHMALMELRKDAAP